MGAGQRELSRELLERVRAALRATSAPLTRDLVYVPDGAEPSSVSDEASLADALGARPVTGTAGRCWLVERSSRLDELTRVGHPEGDERAREALALLVGTPLGRGPLVLLDLETTGLSGGAGTVAFVVGFGLFDEAGLRTRQLVLPRLACERALLEIAADTLAAAGTLVSYNGKAFDVPLLELRYRFQRLPVPWQGAAHLDLLPAARRFWGQGACSLVALEERLLGRLRPDDVPGREIPGCYFRYLRSGDLAALQAVVDHNRRDLYSLASLMLRLVQLVSLGPGGCRRLRECFALGRLFEGREQWARAEACYRSAARWSWIDEEADRLRPEAWARLARCYRRLGRPDEALAAWRGVLEQRAVPARLAYEAQRALAVHFEHRVGDIEAARRSAEQALRYAQTPGQRDELRLRLSRLEAKRARRWLVPPPRDVHS